MIDNKPPQPFEGDVNNDEDCWNYLDGKTEQKKDNIYQIKKPEFSQFEKPKVVFNSDELYSIISRYRTFKLLSTYFKSQGYMQIDSFIIGSSISMLGYLYSHSYRIKLETMDRGTPLSFFIVLGAKTSFEKSGNINLCEEVIIPLINESILSQVDVSEDGLSTGLPASEEGLRRACKEFSVKMFVLDECKSYLRAKENSPRYNVAACFVHLYDEKRFKISVTKNKANNNQSTDLCFANILAGGTAEDIQRDLLSIERLDDGTTNRFLVISTNVSRCGAPKPKRISIESRTRIFEEIKKTAEKHINYKSEQIQDGLLGVKTTKIIRIVKNLHSEVIEWYYEQIEFKNREILDAYDDSGETGNRHVKLLPREMVMKKRLAYILWIERDFQDDLDCATDANTIVDQLKSTCDQLFEESKPTESILKDKIMSLKDKHLPGDRIYVSKLTSKSCILDSKKYAHLLDVLPNFLQSLSKLGMITIDWSSTGQIKSFTFN